MITKEDIGTYWGSDNAALIVRIEDIVIYTSTQESLATSKKSEVTQVLIYFSWDGEFGMDMAILDKGLFEKAYPNRMPSVSQLERLVA